MKKSSQRVISQALQEDPVLELFDHDPLPQRRETTGGWFAIQPWLSHVLLTFFSSLLCAMFTGSLRGIGGAFVFVGGIIAGRSLMQHGQALPNLFHPRTKRPDESWTEVEVVYSLHQRPYSAEHGWLRREDDLLVFRGPRSRWRLASSSSQPTQPQFTWREGNVEKPRASAKMDPDSEAFDMLLAPELILLRPIEKPTFVEAIQSGPIIVHIKPMIKHRPFRKKPPENPLTPLIRAWNRARPELHALHDPPKLHPHESLRRESAFQKNVRSGPIAALVIAAATAALIGSTARYPQQVVIIVSVIFVAFLFGAAIYHAAQTQKKLDQTRIALEELGMAGFIGSEIEISSLTKYSTRPSRHPIPDQGRFHSFLHRRLPGKGPKSKKKR